MLCTTKRLINLDDNKIKRNIEIAKLKALTKNVKHERKIDFILHVKGEYDYKLKCDDRELIFKHILETYAALSNEQLPVFGIKGKLKYYITTEDDAKSNHVKGLPPNEFKLEDGDAVKALGKKWSESSKPKPEDPNAEKKPGIWD